MFVKFHAIHNLPPGNLAHGTAFDDISEICDATQISLTGTNADNAPQA